MSLQDELETHILERMRHGEFDYLSICNREHPGMDHNFSGKLTMELFEDILENSLAFKKLKEK
jgi:hypothetical protein